MKHENFFPDFLGIGAQKAASSWLWSILRRHPSVWMPPIKELHYFDRYPEYSSPSRFATDKTTSRFFGKKKYHLVFRKMFIRRLLLNFVRPGMQRLFWDFRFFFGMPNDDWYASLFAQGDGKVKGEITPGYAILNARSVEHISKLMPDLKVIFILRNPVERVWSQIRFARIHDKPFVDLRKFVNRPGSSLRSDYIRTINIWRSFFSQDKFFIGFYDDIEQDPENFLINLCEFLYIDKLESNTKYIHSKANVSAKKDIPLALEVYLTEKYYEQIQQLSETLGRHATSWLKKAEQKLFDRELGIAKGPAQRDSCAWL